MIDAYIQSIDLLKWILYAGQFKIEFMCTPHFDVHKTR